MPCKISEIDEFIAFDNKIKFIEFDNKSLIDNLLFINDSIIFHNIFMKNKFSTSSSFNTKVPEKYSLMNNGKFLNIFCHKFLIKF